jgi:hypothetical protein
MMTPPDPSNEKRVLDYGGRRRISVRKRLVWGMLVMELLLAGWLTAPRWQPALASLARPWRVHARLLATQYRISHQVLPAGTVIYTEDPHLIATLRTRSGYRDKADYIRSGDGGYPDTWPDPWERIYHFHYMNVRPGEGAAAGDNFGLRRTSGRGAVWIVCLDEVFASQATGDNRDLYFGWTMIRPVGWWPASHVDWKPDLKMKLPLTRSDAITIFAPQPDRADRSRIHIPYELNGHPGVLDAIIAADGHLEYAIASGPVRLARP